MRRRTILTAVAAAMAAVSLVMWLVSRQPLVEHPPQPKDSVTPSERGPSTEASPPLDNGKALQGEERNKAMAQAIERTNVPISFWGKVVDQGQEPIGGARVRYNYSTEHSNAPGVAWGQQKIHKNETITDATGIFAVSGIRGRTLTIESLEKEGYNYVSKEAQVYNYYGNSPSGKFVPESSHPVVFVMMNKAASEQLVSYGGNFGKTVRLPGNGTPIRWNLWKGQPDPEGQLQVTFKRDPTVLARVGQPVAWSAKVEIIGGGIAEAPPDEPLYQAPESGYVSELDYPKVEQKRGIPTRSFYIKTGEGKYGRIELHLYADDEGPTARCLIKTIMNPSGSRVLESAPSPQVTPR